jgi:hypothetical protein
LSNTTSVYSSDTLTLAWNDAVQGFFVDAGTRRACCSPASTGSEQPSLVEQTVDTYGGVFSYCLPAKPSTTGYLTLGGPSGAAAPGFSTMQLLSSQHTPTYYFVMLTGISVGGQQLSLPTSAFEGGTVVDTGT